MLNDASTFAGTRSDPDNESTFTILCARCEPHRLQRLQHHERPGHVESAGDAFRPAKHRRELAGAGSLSLTEEKTEPRHPGYPAAEKDTALRLVAFRLFAKTKIIAPASMVTTLMFRAKP